MRNIAAGRTQVCVTFAGTAIRIWDKYLEHVMPYQNNTRAKLRLRNRINYFYRRARRDSCTNFKQTYTFIKLVNGFMDLLVD